MLVRSASPDVGCHGTANSRTETQAGHGPVLTADVTAAFETGGS